MTTKQKTGPLVLDVCFVCSKVASKLKLCLSCIRWTKVYDINDDTPRIMNAFIYYIHIVCSDKGTCNICAVRDSSIDIYLCNSCKHTEQPDNYYL